MFPSVCRATWPGAIVTAILVFWLAACGDGRPRHAGADSIGFGSEQPDAVAGGVGISSRRRLLDEGSIQDYRAALDQLVEQNDARLAAAEPGDERMGAMALRKRRLDRKLVAVDRAYSEHRDRRNTAQGRVYSFLIRFGPDLQWEADYGISSGDVGLVSSLVRDVVERLRKQPSKPDDPVAARDMMAAEKLAADAFLHLGLLAEDMLDFETAERSYALARAYNPDLGVAVNTAEAQIELFRALGREDEAVRIESERAAMLTR
jgi:tetratricopeptide (TPR) repeat protein